MCASAGAGRGPGERVRPHGSVSRGRPAGQAGPDPLPEGLGVARGQVVAPLPWRSCAGGQKGRKLREETGARGGWGGGALVQTAVGRGLQVRRRDLRAPQHLLTGTPRTVRGCRRVPVWAPGGGGVGARLGNMPPSPHPCAPAATLAAGWSPPAPSTCPTQEVVF